jgi:hypothetical protein
MPNRFLCSVGFVLLPDLKWNQTDPDNLYCLAIVRDRRLRSIRDLRGEHLAVLQNVRDAGVRSSGLSIVCRLWQPLVQSLRTDEELVDNIGGVLIRIQVEPR